MTINTILKINSNRSSHELIISFIYFYLNIKNFIRIKWNFSYEEKWYELNIISNNLRN